MKSKTELFRQFFLTDDSNNRQIFSKLIFSWYKLGHISQVNVKVMQRKTDVRSKINSFAAYVGCSEASTGGLKSMANRPDTENKRL